MEEKAQEQKWKNPVNTWGFERFENILKKGLARKGQGPYLSAPSNNATRRDAEMQGEAD